MNRTPYAMRRAGRWARCAIACAALAAIVATSPAGATAQTTPKSQKIVELMFLAGVNRMVERVPDYYEVELVKRRSQLPAHVADNLQNFMHQAFHVGKLNTQCRILLEKSFSDALIESSMAWLKSPLALKLNRMEVEASSKEGRERLKAWAAVFANEKPKQGRVDLIVRLIRATNLAAVDTEAEVITKEPIIQTVNAAKPEDKQLPQEKVQADLARLRETLLQEKLRSFVLQLLYTYRAASDEELGQYIQFLESPNGVQYIDRINAGFLGALRQSNDWIAERFKQLF